MGKVIDFLSRLEAAEDEEATATDILTEAAANDYEHVIILGVHATGDSDILFTPMLKQTVVTMLEGAKLSILLGGHDED